MVEHYVKSMNLMAVWSMYFLGRGLGAGESTVSSLFSMSTAVLCVHVRACVYKAIHVHVHVGIYRLVVQGSMVCTHVHVWVYIHVHSHKQEAGSGCGHKVFL